MESKAVGHNFESGLVRFGWILLSGFRGRFSNFFEGSKSASICIFLYIKKNENGKCFVETNNMWYTTCQEGANIQIWAYLADDEGKVGWNLPNGFRGYFFKSISWADIKYQVMAKLKFLISIT